MELRASYQRHKNICVCPFIKILLCICLIRMISSSEENSSSINDRVIQSQNKESPSKNMQADQEDNENIVKRNDSGLSIEGTSITQKINGPRASEYIVKDLQPVIENQMGQKQPMDKNQTVQNNPITTNIKNITKGFTPMVNLDSLKGRFIERGQDIDYKETYENDTSDESDTRKPQETTYDMLIEHRLSHSFDYHDTMYESSTNPFNDTTSNEKDITFGKMTKEDDFAHSMETTTEFENVTEPVCVGQVIYCNLSKEEYIALLDDYIFPMPYEWVLIASHMVVFFVGLVGNALVCVAVYRNHSMRTVTNYFIVNLAVADFMVILFCLPPTVLWDVTETWFFGNAMCRIVLYFQVITTLSYTVISSFY